MANFRQWWQTNVDIESQRKYLLKTGRNITWNGGDYHDPKLQYSGITHTGHVIRTFTTDERTRVYGNFALTYKPTDWLSIMGRVTADTYSVNLREERIAIGSVPVRIWYKSSR